MSVGSELYKSTDGGETWDPKLSAAHIAQVHVSPTFAGDGLVYAVADNRIQQSSDGGESWAVQPFWVGDHGAHLLALSPHFSTDSILVAAGDNVYISNDSGATWAPASSPPPIDESSSPRWTAKRLIAAPSGGSKTTLFMTLYQFEPDPPYHRHDQVWTSVDGGMAWSQIATAPDLPVNDIAVGANYPLVPDIILATADDDCFDEDILPSDLYRSDDNGQSWHNLGALPNKSTMRTLFVHTGQGDTVLVGANGAWELSIGLAPTATPEPCMELLANRSFEQDTGDWQIPNTAYSARRTTEEQYRGWWSMLSGIVDSAENRRSYSDFYHEVDLPIADRLSLTL
ncbi:MAG: hypothetical protein GY759_24960 [Chloroflexi bacterium]|nr:hypothetical protein [Chloroflexota bacterium]